MTDTSDSVLSSASTEAALLERIVLQERRVLDALAPYDAKWATLAWLDNLRTIEECINLQTVDWDDEAFERQLFGMPVAGLVHELSPLLAVHASLTVRFSEPFANRFRQLLLQCVCMVRAFQLHGAADVIGSLPTLAGLIDYLQSRRRHFVALLHVLPMACRGTTRIMPIEALTVMLPIVEFTGIPLYSAQGGLMVRLARDSLGLPVQSGVELPLLDAGFLEPERSRIDEMRWPDAGYRHFHTLREGLQPDRIFSAAELRNDIAAIEAAYAEFDLAGSDFAIAAGLVRRLSRQCVVRDFWVEVKPDAFSAMLDAARAPAALRQALVQPVSSYLEGLSSYAPIVQVEGMLRSTVTLLSRFIYNWRARTLDGRKRYQIRTGFIFEAVVKDRLGAQGFAVQDIKRINRREFDVVTVRDGVIWNVQCKNNFVDLSTVDADAHRYARYNRALVTSYEKALDKDRRREHLLLDKLSLDNVQHVVVARFPVVSDNPRIVPFSRLDGFNAVAQALLAQTASA
ncbi:hypothetical protein GCM10007320_43660 [Pseudorhodoferax aquiterrae]|uniref:Restriction endonuclease n=1 Tax=Pseudorhodoferax aquiterrae TaxID=747304 RepID=A0ABQ3G7B5_9BURK|nr:hypothetical protein [Pseudorhodoferax aquiterrae]GHC93015.1 hypothetical protein GCM10007320_43660 [Pseudorhodoferax aquiterrae]